MPGYAVNEDLTYIPNRYVKENTFIDTAEKPLVPPKYDNIKDKLPKPIFDGHGDVIDCYNLAWKLGFEHLRMPKEGTRFVSTFIDAAFNDCLFMWDSCFMLMFGKYADRVFPFQKTLDNFYSFQHRDGFICREIDEIAGRDRYSRFDPSSTGPNLLAWCEMQYYDTVHDTERLRRVYAPLRAFHIWLRRNFTWPDGSYFSSGWGCGMDNIPRFKTENDDAFDYECQFAHGHMTWLDTCLEQLLNCDCLIRMNEILGGEDDVSDLKQERKELAKLINTELWDENDAFYYDRWRDGQLNHVKHIGAYWALVADVIPKDKLDRFVAHLENENEFCRPNAVPTLSADHPMYQKTGCYWRGSVWAPTSYMVLRGLERQGKDELAYTIAEKFFSNVMQVYRETGTLWENYMPEEAKPGIPARPDFVGWTGLVPITVLFEFVFGIRPHVAENEIVWHVNRLERHGVAQYPFGDGVIDLVCEARESADDEPQITVRSDKPLTVTVKWNGHEKTVRV